VRFGGDGPLVWLGENPGDDGSDAAGGILLVCGAGGSCAAMRGCEIQGAG